MRNVEFLLCEDCDYKYMTKYGDGNHHGEVQTGAESCDICERYVQVFIYRKATKRLWKAFLDSIGVMSHEREGQ